ncbi:hypothetical protein KIW84_045361 [Lathyrus oleraceus]|uniref:DUF4283 domain-containing protein n=1 Tax=Pisum sativum TaxID=3888 RepID=A0A9D5AX44_PEA|nr:hypothetical protein KIW84_045361 [Pisum sativum]
MAQQEDGFEIANPRKALDPKESRARKIMSLKIQYVIKDLESSHSQTDSERKPEELGDQFQLQIQRDNKISYKNMVTGESCKAPGILIQEKEVMKEIDEEENMICIEHKHLWARKGVLSIVDLGQDYYLVTFSCEEHHQTTLMKGTWLIYDHYLTLREWSPNLCPSNDIVEQLVVWVRISGLPIEYYDQIILTLIDNFIVKAIKADKKNLPMEGGRSSITSDPGIESPQVSFDSEGGDKVQKANEDVEMVAEIPMNKQGI